MRHKERCIAASLELGDQVPTQPASASVWSPLSEETFVEVYTEAHLLALQIESQSRTQVALEAQPQNPCSQGVESFVQESKLKMSLFEKEQETEKSPKSLKRETFYLSDSPLAGTPLSKGQPGSPECLLPASPAPRGVGPVQRLQPPAQALPKDSRVTAPPRQAGPQKRAPSKLLPPRALAARSRHLLLGMEKVGPQESTSGDPDPCLHLLVLALPWGLGEKPGGEAWASPLVLLSSWHLPRERAPPRRAMSCLPSIL